MKRDARTRPASALAIACALSASAFGLAGLAATPVGGAASAGPWLALCLLALAAAARLGPEGRARAERR